MSRSLFQCVARVVMIISMVVVTSCAWHVEVRWQTTDFDYNGYPHTRYKTIVWGGPQNKRLVMAVCQADSQCGSDYCHEGYCVPASLAPTDGYGNPYHIHQYGNGSAPGYESIRPSCEHDSVDGTRGIEVDRYGRPVRELDNVREPGCPGIKIGTSGAEYSNGIPIGEGLAPKPEPWWYDEVIIRQHHAPDFTCIAAEVGGQAVIDCPPWGDPYFQTGRYDVPVTGPDAARVSAMETRDVMRLVTGPGNELWLDGPAKGMPGKGYGPPYNAERGDFKLPQAPALPASP